MEPIFDSSDFREKLVLIIEDGTPDYFISELKTFQLMKMGEEMICFSNPFNPENEEHMQLLNDLWKILDPLHPFSVDSKDWEKFGFYVNFFFGNLFTKFFKKKKKGRIVESFFEIIVEIEMHHFFHFELQ